MIPKIIHYFWFGNKKIPHKFKKYIKGWKRICPDYEIKFWTNDNYNINKCSFMSEAAKNNKWAFVTDYARIDVIEEYGGIYLDTDVELIKNLDPLLNYCGYAGFECSNFINFGLGFGAEPHNPILKEIKDFYKTAVFNKDFMKNNTSPMIQTKIFMKYGMKNDQTEQDIEGFHIFPPEYFCPMNYSQIIENLTENTYSIHHFAATWFDKKELLHFKWNNLKTKLKYIIKNVLK